MSDDEAMTAETAEMYLRGDARTYHNQAAHAKSKVTRHINQRGADMCNVILAELARLRAANAEQAEQIERLTLEVSDKTHECSELTIVSGRDYREIQRREQMIARQDRRIAEQAATIERLERERDTLIERWPDSTKYAVAIVVKRKKGFDLAPIAWGSSYTEPEKGEFDTKREAVRFAAGLGEEGANVPTPTK